ncbi:MAG: DUF493 family protein [Planctomycetota bacterium]|jgi:putative lipoic acid-binding regulatory protein
MPKLPSRELLLDHHEFPGPFVIKAFGPGLDSFREAIRGATARAVGERFTVTERSTQSGGAVCLTLTLHAETVDEVLLGYTELTAVPGLKLIF